MNDTSSTPPDGPPPGAAGPSTQELTRLLRVDGEQGTQSVLPLIYDELRRVAGHRMASERANHTLQATALVHEVYIKLLGDEELDWSDRRRFYGAAAEAMRRILVDHARKVGSLRRGGDRQRVTLGSPESPGDLDHDQILALSDALEKLETEDPEAAEVTRLRFFGGLTAKETASAMGQSERSIHREWSFARARLQQFLDDE